MNKEELIKYLKEAANNNTLLTPKHDPNNLGITFPSYRSVLSHQASSSLQNFINSEEYKIHEYENTKSQQGKYYFKITPNNESHFSVPASGVTAHSSFASSVLDCLVVVSGSTQGWHIFGSDHKEIELRVSRGDLIDVGPLT